MTADQKLSTMAWLIPCYNEEHTIGQVIDAIRHSCPRGEIYVFDNHSTDSTAAIARQHGANVFQEQRRGKGNVVRQMLQKIDADYYLLIDGDATYDVSSWQKLVKVLQRGHADMVVGTRLQNHAPDGFRSFHRLGNRVLTSLINVAFGCALTDVLSGYRVLNKVAAKTLAINSKRFEIEAEITIQCLEHNMMIAEVPLPYSSRPEGSFSKLSTFRDGAIILYTILRFTKDYKALTFFGSLALVLGMMSMFFWLGVGASLLGQGLMVIAFGAVFSGLILNSISQRFKEQMQVIRKLHWKELAPGQSKAESTDDVEQNAA